MVVESSRQSSYLRCLIAKYTTFDVLSLSVTVLPEQEISGCLDCHTATTHICHLVRHQHRAGSDTMDNKNDGSKQYLEEVPTVFPALFQPYYSTCQNKARGPCHQGYLFVHRAVMEAVSLCCGSDNLTKDQRTKKTKNKEQRRDSGIVTRARHQCVWTL
jgi:hypothetical protein